MRQKQKRKKDRETGRACDSCNQPRGVDAAIDGVHVVMCPTCQASDFRKQRVLERAKAAS